MALKMLLLCGEGILPVLTKDKARESLEVVAVSCRLFKIHPSLKPDYLLDNLSLRFLWDIVRKENPSSICFVGKIPKSFVFHEEVMDPQAWSFLSSFEKFTDREILKGFFDLFTREGIEIVSPLVFLEEWVTEEGLLFGSPPTDREWCDILYGQRIARFLANEEIGQTVVIARGTVVALEGAEGTDETIRRGLLLSRGGVVVKVARSNQDFFIDVPTVGAQTVRVVGEGGGRVLALESRKTILIDREEVAKLSRLYGITILGIPP